jgi:hypothetical protein
MKAAKEKENEIRLTEGHLLHLRRLCDDMGPRLTGEMIILLLSRTICTTTTVTIFIYLLPALTSRKRSRITTKGRLLSLLDLINYGKRTL